MVKRLGLWFARKFLGRDFVCDCCHSWSYSDTSNYSHSMKISFCNKCMKKWYDPYLLIWVLGMQFGPDYQKDYVWAHHTGRFKESPKEYSGHQYNESYWSHVRQSGRRFTEEEWTAYNQYYRGR